MGSNFMNGIYISVLLISKNSIFKNQLLKKTCSFSSTGLHPLDPQARIDPEMQFRQKSIFHHEESILSNNPKHVRSQLSMPFLWYITPYNILTRKKIRAKKLKKKS